MIKNYEDFNNSPEKTIQLINQMADSDKYQTPQLNIIDKNKFGEFIKYLCDISDITHIDAIGGTEAVKGTRRYSIDDKVKVEDILHMAPTGIACGIKVCKYPMGSYMEYQTWPGGYIEGFIRMDSDDPRFGEYFIWSYIKMNKLEDIINNFGKDLKLL